MMVIISGDGDSGGDAWSWCRANDIVMMVIITVMMHGDGGGGDVELMISWW